MILTQNNLNKLVQITEHLRKEFSVKLKNTIDYLNLVVVLELSI